MTDRATVSDLQRFAALMTAFGKVERVYRLPGTDRRENDQEHSYLLAMVGWYLAETNGLSLSHEKILKYALAHDLVEVYAGDTFIYSKDKAHLASKQDREDAAANRLAEEWPSFAGMHEYMTGYMRREDPESRFVYALDKILPLLLIYADGGRSWREHGVTLDMLVENKTSKVALSPEVQPYFDDLIAVLREHQEAIFGS